MWIGLLWYFNFVQMPTMPKIRRTTTPAISKSSHPTSLFWFRYGALATVITGLLLAWMQGYIVQALTCARLHHDRHRHVAGACHGLQRLVHHLAEPAEGLGLVEATAEQKAAAAKTAIYASRFNTMLSIAMLYCMVAQQNAPI